MPQLDDFIRALEQLKHEQPKRDKEFAELKGVLKTLRHVFPDSQTHIITAIYEYALKETETRIIDDLSILEIILSLSSDQAKEFDALRDIIRSSVSENKEVLKKIGKIESWKGKREQMLSKIDEYIEDRKRFFEEDR